MGENNKKIKIGRSLEDILGSSAGEIRELERQLERKRKNLPNQDTLFENKRRDITSILQLGDMSEILHFMLNLEPNLADVGEELNIAFSVLNFVKEKMIDDADEFFEFFDYFLQYFSKIVRYYEAEFEKKKFYDLIESYLIDLYNALETDELFSPYDLPEYLDFIKGIPDDVLPQKYRLDLFSYMVKPISIMVLKHRDIDLLEESIDYFFEQHRDKYALDILDFLLNSIESSYMEFIMKEDMMDFFIDLLNMISEKLHSISIREEYIIPIKYKIHEIFKTWVNKKEKIRIDNDLFDKALQTAKEVIGEEKTRKLIDEFYIYTKKQIKFIR